MKKAILFTFSLLTVAALTAQVKPGWDAIFNRINTEVQTHSKAYETLADAMASIGHRLT